MEYTKITTNKDKSKTVLDIILTVLEYKTEGVQGLKRKGFCSNYLADTDIGEHVLLYLKQSSFHLPPNLSHPSTQPILLVGAGSGLAPFRGFWQQLMLDSINESKQIEIVQKLEMLEFNETKVNDSSMVLIDELSDLPDEKSINLFFGCRDKRCNLLDDETYLYSKIMNRFNAFSRETSLPKQYVSDVMKKEHQLIYDALVEQKGLIYVCGKIAMANSVFKTLVSIIAEQLIDQHVIEHSETANITAQDFMNSLIDDGRYHQDIFGTDDI